MNVGTGEEGRKEESSPEARGQDDCGTQLWSKHPGLTESQGNYTSVSHLNIIFSPDESMQLLLLYITNTTEEAIIVLGI